MSNSMLKPSLDLSGRLESLASEDGARRREELRALAEMLERFVESQRIVESRAFDRIAMLEHRQQILQRAVAAAKVGIWECDLPSEHLTWTPEVYGLFDLPDEMRINRKEILGFYTDKSRKALEEVRYKAIATRTGFSLDTEITTALGQHRWLRITATVDYENDLPVRLFGIKQDVTEQKLASGA